MSAATRCSSSPQSGIKSASVLRIRFTDSTFRVPGHFHDTLVFSLILQRHPYGEKIFSVLLGSVILDPVNNILVNKASPATCVEADTNSFLESLETSATFPMVTGTRGLNGMRHNLV